MTRLFRVLLTVALVATSAPLAWAQGVLAPYAKLQFFDNNGDPLAGGLLYTYDAGTTSLRSTYSDSGLSTANANPVVLDSAGRVTVYLDPTRSYKFILRTSAGVEVFTQDNIIGPQSGVFTVSASDTRGFRITRSGADAGLSITSSGGSGKAYGIVSNTSGGLRIQDDSDGTPRMEWLGDNITATLTGTFTVSGGSTVLGATSVGALTATSTVSVVGAATFNGTSTFNGSASLNATAPLIYFVQSGAAANNGRWYLRADSEQFQIRTENDASSAAASAITIDRTGTTVDSIGLGATATTNSGRYNSATLQPGFLAYNSASDNAVSTGATVDFDTEAYDEAGNFATDTFTAPVTGRYQFCVTVNYSDNAASSYGLRLVTSARSYRLDYSGATTSGASNGCVITDLSSGGTASVQVDTGDGTGITIEGGASPVVTFFSGRLMP